MKSNEPAAVREMEKKKEKDGKGARDIKIMNGMVMEGGCQKARARR